MTTHPDHHPSTPSAAGVPAVLGRMQGQVRDLAETMWAARDGHELMDTIAQIETLKSTLDGIELSVVRELDATHAIKPLGWASTQDYVTAVAGATRAPAPLW